MGSPIPGLERPRVKPHPEQGDAIRAERKRIGLSQAQLAEEISRSRSYVSNLEAGWRCASGRTAKRLKLVLGVDIPLPAAGQLDHALARQEARKAAWRAAGESPRPQALPVLVLAYPTRFGQRYAPERLAARLTYVARHPMPDDARRKR